MPKGNLPIIAFNRGIISKLGLARIDLKRAAFSAMTMVNWMARSLGAMSLRPGFGYILGTYLNHKPIWVPFIFSVTDTAKIELTDQVMRVVVSDAVVTRPSVSSAITNGTFNSDLTGWTDADESGATSAWATGGYMSLIGTAYNAAIRKQTITVSGGDQNVEHALRVIVAKGKVTLRVGSADEGDQYITETTLGIGSHSLSFTPTGNVFVKLFSYTRYATLIDSIVIESAGAMTLPTPWVEADLGLIRTDQSADVIYCACDGYQQRKIERRATRSWSIVLYQPEDGPFRPVNLTKTTLTPSQLFGDITLTASKALFRSTHVGALFRILSVGQLVRDPLTGDNQFTNSVRVTGVGAGRNVTLFITSGGGFVGTVTLQRSIDDQSSWVDVTTYNTTLSSTVYNDGLDNQIAFYRLGFKTGDYASGTIDEAALDYPSGGTSGVLRISAVTNSTTATAYVLSELGNDSASADWSEGAWSDYRGYPTAVALAEGRLGWYGRDKFWESVSDAFEGFDDATIGDAGPISGSIGSGPVDRINWALALERIAIGGQGAEHFLVSSSLDEPLTPTNRNIKSPSNQGSAAVQAVKVDDRAIFAQRSGQRLYATGYDQATFKYITDDITKFAPDVVAEDASVTITRLAVQRQPDTRVHAVLSDGTVLVEVYDKLEDVSCLLHIETDGDVEDVIVMPGTREDAVYYSVKRTINGSTVRYLEKWALESECVGGTLNKQADAFIIYSGVATTTITGLGHLEAATVVVWGNGKDLGTYLVSGGQITGISQAVTSAVVGLGYMADWESAKLAYAAGLGTALTQPKQVGHLGLILANTHYQGLLYGPDADHLDNLPLIEDGAETAADTVWDSYDKESFELDGTWDTDSRLYLRAQAPRPATILGAILSIETNDRI